MDLTKRREGVHDYIIMKKNQESFDMKMIQENHITGLASVTSRSFNGEIYYYYDVSGMQSLDMYAKGNKLKIEFVKRLLERMYLLLKSVSQYFLDVNQICFDPSSIYFNETEVCFCYLPRENASLDASVDFFVEYLLGVIDCDHEQSVVFVYQFYKAVKDHSKPFLIVLEDFLTIEAEEESLKITEENSVIEDINSVVPLEDVHSLKQEKETTNNTYTSSFVFFFILMCLSMGYSLFLFMKLEMHHIVELLGNKEGMVAAVFFILGIIGMFICYAIRKNIFANNGSD